MKTPIISLIQKWCISKECCIMSFDHETLYCELGMLEKWVMQGSQKVFQLVGSFHALKVRSALSPNPRKGWLARGYCTHGIYINRGQRRAMHYMAWNFAGQMTQQCRSAVQKLSCMKIRWTPKANDKSYSEAAEADCITAVLRLALAPNLCMQGNILC